MLDGESHRFIESQMDEAKDLVELMGVSLEQAMSLLFLLKLEEVRYELQQIKDEGIGVVINEQ